MSAYVLFLLLITGLLIAVALVAFLPAQRSRRQPGATADRQRTGGGVRDDDRHWYGGVFYYNPDDPNPFIPKRYGLGWTVNFGHPVGKLVMGILIALLLLPVVLAIFVPGLRSYGCHPSGCYPLPPLP